MPAHFLFARFPASEHRAAVDWMRMVDDVSAVHGADVRVERLDPAHAGPVVGWRLVSDNHRELARGCRFFASEREARASTAPMLARAADLVVHSAPEPRLRTTGWFATIDGELVMMGARRYENRSVARNAGALAARLVGEIAASAARGDTDDLQRSAPEFAL